jgi:hypothetical protein
MEIIGLNVCRMLWFYLFIYLFIPGFHLSAEVLPLCNTNPNTNAKSQVLNVAVVCDRKRITSCHCSCSKASSWCSHIVAVCLSRINEPHNVELRAPVSESLSKLQRDQLQKFAQYLISELPQQVFQTFSWKKFLKKELFGQKIACSKYV